MVEMVYGEKKGVIPIQSNGNQCLSLEKRSRMPAKKLKEFLDDHHVPYELIPHSPAYTAQEIAAVAHVSGREMAKTVMLNVDGKIEMAVLPANERLDVKQVSDAMGTDQVRLAREDEFKELFPGCETGAMPALGNLYGIEVQPGL